MPNKDITLTAQWRTDENAPKTYVVNHMQQNVHNDEYTLQETEIITVANDASSTVTGKSYEGFTLEGVAEKAVDFAAEQSVAFTYARNTVDLSWDFGGGTARNNSYTQSGMIKFGTKIIAPSLKKAGAKDYAWNNPIVQTMGTAAQSYTATWTPIRYTVKLDANGGTGVAMTGFSLGYDESKALPENTYTRAGYEFNGWTEQRDGTGTSYADKAAVLNLTTVEGGNVTLYANWSPVTYKITYQLDGGTNHGENVATYTQFMGNLILREPTKTSYTFKGWFTNPEKTEKPGNFAIKSGDTGDKAFFAKWEVNQYTVVFNKNIGDNTTASQEFIYDVAQSFNANSWTRDGYSFDGWSTNSNGTGTKYADQQSVKNLKDSGKINLYAIWKPVTYQITYSIGGGSSNGGNPATYTVESNFTFNAPITSVTGDIFGGWYTTSDFSGSKVTNITELRSQMKPITLYANWLNPGVFRIYKNPGNGQFSVTRTGGTYGTVNVYFRTLNGSAIGGTHFTHQGGPAAMVQFADGSSSAKTISISVSETSEMYTGDTGDANYTSTKYVKYGVQRNFSVELLSATNGGRLGNTTATTTIEYTGSNKIVFEGEPSKSDIIDGAFSGPGLTAVSFNLNPEPDYYSVAASHQYFTYTNTSMSVIKPHVGLVNLIFTPIGFTDEQTFSTSNEFLQLFETFKLPNAILYLGTINFITADNAYYETNLNCARVSLQYIKKEGHYTGLTKGEWGSYEYKVIDERAPKLLGIGKLAAGAYGAGEKIVISLIFDEIISESSATISVSGIDGLTYVDGINTNVLYFEGTVGSGGFTPSEGGVIDASKVTINGKTSIKDLAGVAME